MAVKRSAGEAKLELAEQLLADGEPEDSLGAASEALELLRKAGDETKVRQALQATCSARIASGDVDGGLQAAEAELDSLKQAGDKKGQAEMLIVLADLYLLMDKPKLATQAATDAQEIFEGLGDVGGQGKATRAALYSYLARGKKKTALKVAKVALAMSQSAEDKEGEAASWDQLAAARMQSHHLNEVPAALNEALAIYRQTGDKARQASTLHSLACLNLIKGSADEALRFSEQARSLFQEEGLARSAANAWDASVAAYMTLGRSDEVLKKVKAEMAAAKREGNGAKMAAAEQRLIRANLKLGDEEGAMHAAKRACARMSEAGDWKGQAAMLHVASVLHLRCDRVELALRAAQEALQLLQAHKERPREQAALRAVAAEAHERRGEEPPLTAPRAAALTALEELARALQERRVQAFQDALNKLQKSGAYTAKDTKAAIEPVVAKDKSAASFVRRHMPSVAEILAAPEQKMKVTSLRKFTEENAGGVVNGLEWTQTQGKVVLRYVLTEDATEDQVKVELSCNGLQVTVAGKKLAPMTGTFKESANRTRSWWVLEKEAIKRRGRGVDMSTNKLTVHVELAKAEQKVWQDLWYTGDLKHPSAKGRFCWTGEMQKAAEAAAADARLTELAAGKPGFALAAEAVQQDDPAYETGLFPQQSTSFMFSPDELIVGLDCTQDTRTVTIRVIFDGEAVRVAEEKIALEDLVAADVWEDRVSVFLRGDDQNPILCGQFWGMCVPYMSKWKMTTDDSFRTRQANFQTTVPVLKITITKAEDSQCKWAKIFSNCWQHRLMMKNSDELEMMLAQMQDDQSLASLSYEERNDLMQRLAEWREERFQGIPGAQRLTRRGNDNQDSDFYVNLSNTVDEITKRTGSQGRARWSEELGRYTYIY